MDNIYQPPQSQVETKPTQDTADYALYKISGIGVATFFGSLFAGGILTAINLRRLGEYNLAKKVLWGTGVLTVLILAVGMLIPEDWSIPNTVFIIPQVFAMIYYAKNHLDQPIFEHQEASGKMESNWKAFGISLLVLLGLFALAFAALMSLATAGLIEL